jgi:DNA-binding CsgD family transcriptional regulator
MRYERALDLIGDVAEHGNDVVTFWNEAAEVIGPAVPIYGGLCWFTLDPASLLMTSHVNPEMPEIPPEWLETEYYEDDVYSLTSVARSEQGYASLYEVTGGDPSSTRRWQENMQLGGDQEVVVALRTSVGDSWGAVSLYREPGQPQFSAEEMAFLRSAAPVLAEGTRRGLLIGEARDPEGPDAPGLLVLDGGEVESSTPGTERLVSDLPGGDWDSGRLPAAVTSVAAQAIRSAEDRESAGEVALARVLAESGTWVVVHGARLVGEGPQRVAVILEPAHPARITPLLMSAYGLTEREQDVTRLVLQGESTAGIAERLFVSPHTVQQHLKNIFEKTGVRSRRDLVGKVFFSHYEPRVRDNEQRTHDGRPLRGGPVERT